MKFLLCCILGSHECSTRRYLVPSNLGYILLCELDGVMRESGYPGDCRALLCPFDLNSY